MIAVDTNVLVRLITGDDERQVELALALLAREPFHVSLTVAVETDWVLRSKYGYDRERVCAGLGALRSLEAVEFEADDEVAWALDRYAEAGEFADYLHIAAAREIGRFASFERKLARRAGPDSPASVEFIG